MTTTLRYHLQQNYQKDRAVAARRNKLQQRSTIKCISKCSKTWKSQDQTPNFENPTMVLKKVLPDVQGEGDGAVVRRSIGRGGENEVNKADSGSSMTIVGVVQVLGMCLPDFKSKRKGKQKVSKEPHQQVVETLDKIREKTKETVKGLESMTA